MTETNLNSPRHTTSLQTKPPRYSGLDWLRAGATICVVMLHAGVPYLTHPFPGLVWSTVDPNPSPILDALTWNINVWVMPLFFLLSGFLAAGLMERLGAADFARHRLSRIGGPLLFAMVFILPIDLYAWLLSWVNQGWVEPVKLRSLKVQGPLGDGMWGLSHLWYLEYLLLYSLTAAVYRAWRDRTPGVSGVIKFPRLRSATSFRTNAFLNAVILVIAAATLWFQPRILIGFRHSFFPQAANFLFFGCWFILGWLQHGRALPRFSSVPVARVVAGMLAFPILLGMIHEHVSIESVPAANLLLPILFVATAWLISSGLFLSALCWNRVPPKLVTTIAEASFWIYLIHHPVVGLAQGNMAFSSAPVLVKYLVSVAVGLIFPLLTYPILVRNTWVGVVLNGRRPTETITATAARNAEHSPKRQAA